MAACDSATFGDVLAGGDEQRRERIRGVRAVVRRARQKGAGRLDLARPKQLRVSTPMISWSSSLRMTASATTRLPRVSSMLMWECFLSVSMPPERMYFGSPGIIPLDPLAGRQSRLAGHVLAGGVAGGVVEAQVAQRADLILADMDQLARVRGRTRPLA